MIIYGEGMHNLKNQPVQTALVCGRATRDGELIQPEGNKAPYGFARIPVTRNADGSEEYWNIKCWDRIGRHILENLKDSEMLCAVGRVEHKTRNDKIFTNLIADFVWTYANTTQKPKPNKGLLKPREREEE